MDSETEQSNGEEEYDDISSISSGGEGEEEIGFNSDDLFSDLDSDEDEIKVIVAKITTR